MTAPGNHRPMTAFDGINRSVITIEHVPMGASRGNVNAFKRHRFMWWRHILGGLIR